MLRRITPLAKMPFAHQAQGTLPAIGGRRETNDEEYVRAHYITINTEGVHADFPWHNRIHGDERRYADYVERDTGVKVLLKTSIFALKVAIFASDKADANDFDRATKMIEDLLEHVYEEARGWARAGEEENESSMSDEAEDDEGDESASDDESEDDVKGPEDETEEEKQPEATEAAAAAATAHRVKRWQELTWKAAAAAALRDAGIDSPNAGAIAFMAANGFPIAARFETIITCAGLWTPRT